MAVAIQNFDSRQKMSRKDFEIFHYRETVLKQVNIHHHDFYEIYFFLGGNVEYFVDGETFKLAKGDLLLINPMQLHQPIKTQGGVYERIVLWIDRNYLSSLCCNDDLLFCFRQNKSNSVNILHSNVIMHGRVHELFELLNKEFHSDNFASNAYSQSLFLQLLIEINRLVKTKKENATPTKNPNLVSRVITYINSNFNKDVSLDLLSKKFFVSKFHLSHEFSQQVGISVYKYLTLKRLLISKELLLNGHSASQVAVECGFHNYPTFFRIFKSHYGINPTKISQKKANIDYK